MTKKKILVIDDDQFFGKTLAAALPEGKYDVELAEDGEVGLEKLKSAKPDLVVLDLLMPKMGGAEFMEAMKKQEGLPKVPILVSSNLSSLKKISDVMALGAVGYIIKSDESLSSIVQDIERILANLKS